MSDEAAAFGAPVPLRTRASKIAFVAAALAAAALTLYRLDDTPPGLAQDETAIALTARALWETGSDLGGRSLPLYPISYPDLARPMPVNPLYTYFAIPFALAGPGAVSARLPAVLWLWAAAVGIGLMARELTRDAATGAAIGVTASVTPWLFVLGRIGWEAVTFPALTAFALWLLLRGVRTGRGSDFVISGLLSGLSLYSYSTARLLVPLGVLGAAAILAREAGARRHALRYMIAAGTAAVPLAWQLVREPSILTWRFSDLAIRTESGGILAASGSFLANYVRYFSPQFLFLRGDPNLRHGTGSGMLLWICGPPIVLGVWEMGRRRREPAIRLVLAGLAIAPVAASLMRVEQPHAIRSFPSVVFWAAAAALGLQRITQAVKARRAAVVGLTVAAIVNVGLFAGDYFGAYRERAFDAFDRGAGETLEEAFRLREGRALYVPPTLYGEVRHSVILAYWGKLPVAEWLREGPAPFGIHVWKGEAPAGSFIIIDTAAEPPPSRARRIFPRTPRAHGAYTLYAREGP